MSKSVANALSFFVLVLTAATAFVTWAILSGNAAKFHLPARPGTCPSTDVIANWRAEIADAIDLATGGVDSDHLQETHEQTKGYLPSNLQGPYERELQDALERGCLGQPPNLDASDRDTVIQTATWVRDTCPEEWQALNSVPAVPVAPAHPPTTTPAAPNTPSTFPTSNPVPPAPRSEGSEKANAEVNDIVSGVANATANAALRGRGVGLAVGAVATG